VNRAAFLDRDGVINRKAREGEYLTRWEEIEILPGVARAIGLLNLADFRVIVVSNQRCVAKGLITSSELEAMHRRMCAALANEGASVDAIYYCPHEIQPPCSCRKPGPGMLLTAANEHEIDLNESWMVGDSDIDIAAGISAGCRTVRLVSDRENIDGRADLTATSLLEATQRILAFETSLPVLARPIPQGASAAPNQRAKIGSSQGE